MIKASACLSAISAEHSASLGTRSTNAAKHTEVRELPRRDHFYGLPEGIGAADIAVGEMVLGTFAKT